VTGEGFTIVKGTPADRARAWTTASLSTLEASSAPSRRCSAATRSGVHGTVVGS
jgi:hypothetical protein